MLGILTAQVLTGASCSKFVAWLLLFVIQLFCLLIWSVYTNLCSVRMIVSKRSMKEFSNLSHAVEIYGHSREGTIV